MAPDVITRPYIEKLSELLARSPHRRLAMLICRKVLPLFFLLVFSMSSASAEVFKWVDEAGNVHFGDRIPEQHKQAGESVELSVRTPSVEEQSQAESRAESVRRAVDDLGDQRREQERLEESEQGSAQQKASTLPEKVKPGQGRLTREQRMANYEAEMKRYRESLECFGKYQIKGGGTRGYAFEECESVKKPRHPDVR